MFDALAKKITQEMSESEIYQILHSEKAEFNKGLVELSDRVKSGENIDDVIASIQESSPSALFLKIIENELRNDTVSYIESEYIRGMELSSFKELIKYSLDNIIISKESEKEVAKHLHIDKTQFGYLVKFMNTANDLIIIKRFTKNNFSIAMFDLFRLEAEKIEYIWHLFEESKSSLITAALLNAVTSIRRANNNLDFLYELLSSLGEE